MKLILAFTAVLIPAFSQACMWSTATNELRTLDTVPVCFVNIPTARTDLDSRAKLDAVNAIKNSLRELDQATNINFSGFERCGPRDGSPQIRISMDDTASTGAAVTEPGYSREEINVHFNYMTPRGNTHERQNTPEQPINLEVYRWLAKHEVLHLFGIHHDQRLAGQWEKIQTTEPAMRLLPDPKNPQRYRPVDRTSVMNLSSEDLNMQYTGVDSRKIPAGKLLSDLDVQCVNGVLGAARRSPSDPVPAKPVAPVTQ